ncbi:uncharacterized protein LOC113315714 [Papaver somniferum]|uniref:uncharacterized protein LOC113315714 n=1 Tax=Papaver somniferum TaxID=3469 RepID=UPI000E700259|nr:uncharacterized protein LOC113315714 [Papaver somniferum]XP_026419761.1 uncharacterized protein LOC113315714 [Papaver somniferum]
MGVWESGFGYVSSTNEYKVVVMIIFEKETKLREVHVYTLGSGNGWRNIGKFNLETSREGVFVNGALYWVDDKLKTIVPFHLAEEKFGKHLSPPPLSSGDFHDYYKLGFLDGCLYFARDLDVLGSGYGAECWDAWLLKEKDDNHGMKEREGHQSTGWSEDRVYYELSSELFAVTRSYSVLSYRENKIYIDHDQEASTSETIVDFNECIGAVFPHRNTVVALKELGEETESLSTSCRRMRRWTPTYKLSFFEIETMTYFILGQSAIVIGWWWG